MKHLGDITKLRGDQLDKVDIITFGSPCQNLSYAGNRTGLIGEQSSLFHQAIRIIEEMRRYTDGNYPTFAIWENVLGAFVSGNRLDFRAILESFSGTTLPMPKLKWANAGMVRGKEFEICWRVLDAQHFGEPKLLQRRKRIFIVCDFRGHRAHKVLYKPKKMPENIKNGGKIKFKNTGGNRNNIKKARENTPIVRPFQDRKMRQAAKKGAQTPFTTSFGIPNEPFPTLIASHPFEFAFYYKDKIEEGFIRNITPLECERLMGFPEDYTKYAEDGNIINDNARYKVIGNAIALPCLEYIMSGIKEVLSEEN